MYAPAITVLMSAYNVEKYIREAMDSILNQTFRDFEFIIVDDASTDGTLAIIESYKDDRIRIIKNETNIKLAASLNKGLRITRGKYIARMDADDISHLERFQKLYDFMERNPQIDICGTHMKLFGSEDAVWGGRSDDKEIKAGLIWGSTVEHASVLMRSETILKNNLFYDETFPVGQDWKYWYDAKNHANFSSLEEVLYYYRRGEQNMTVKFGHQSKDRYSHMHRLMLEDLGLSPSERELKLHQFIIGLFSISPSPDAVKEARAWFRKLIGRNNTVKQYDPATFERIANEHWTRLFYLIAPFGSGTVWAYTVSSGITFTQLSYYLKYSLNKLIGRKK